MSPTRRDVFRLSAGAIAATLIPVTTATAATEAPERTVGIYIDTTGDSIADMRMFLVSQLADGSLRLDIPDSSTGVPIPNLTATQLTDTVGKLPTGA